MNRCFSAVVHNDHDAPKTVKVSLELDGNNLEAIDGAAQTVEIAARSEARVDWRVKALREGEATFRMRADSGDDGDAVERKLPVLVHGMSRQDAWSRAVEPGQDSAQIQMEVPEQRRPDQSKLTVRFSPTIAGAVVDAIPYLASYPHGCTEQTLNRFVPAVIAQQMLQGSQDQPRRSQSQAHQSQSAGTRQRRRPRGAVETMAEESRCSMKWRWRRWSPQGVDKTHVHAELRRRLGLVLRLWRILPIRTPPRWSSMAC